VCVICPALKPVPAQPRLVGGGGKGVKWAYRRLVNAPHPSYPLTQHPPSVLPFLPTPHQLSPPTPNPSATSSVRASSQNPQKPPHPPHPSPHHLYPSIPPLLSHPPHHPLPPSTPPQPASPTTRNPRRSHSPFPSSSLPIPFHTSPSPSHIAALHPRPPNIAPRRGGWS
jgi:hypothetical protein